MPGLATQTVEVNMRVLTHSSASLFRKCERAYQFTYEIGLRPLRDEEPLRMGSAFHDAIEVLRKTSSLTEAWLHIDEAYSSMPAYFNVGIWILEREKVKGMVAGWWMHYQPHLAGERPAFSELEFSFPLNERWIEAGKIDGVTLLPSDELLVDEYKTATTIDEDRNFYLSRLTIDHQTSRYFLAAERLDLPVDGIRYFVTKKPAIRPKKPVKANVAEYEESGTYFGIPCHEEDWSEEKETPVMYRNRLMHDMAENPESYFFTTRVTRNSADFEKFLREDEATVQKIEWALHSGSWLPNYDACTLCRFRRICLSGMSPEDLGEIPPEGFFYSADLHPELANHG